MQVLLHYPKLLQEAEQLDEHTDAALISSSNYH